MKSARPGRAISAVEVVHISAHGFWIFLEPARRELFLPFRTFPWFAEATIRELSVVVLERGHLLRWPALDVDLDVARIEHPERYPLVSRPGGRLRRTNRGRFRETVTSKTKARAAHQR